MSLSKMAKIDLARLRADGFRPTDEEVVRLNDLGTRIERGKSTTVANAPRTATAGNVVFYEPTVAALMWWHDFGCDAAWTNYGKIMTQFFMLAYSREPDFLERLTSAGEIRRAVRKWKSTVHATDAELWRALMWVKSGANFVEDVDQKKDAGDPVSEEERFDELARTLISAAGAVGVSPDDLRTRTQTELVALLVAARKHARIPIKMSVAKDYIAYQATVRKIEARGTGNG